MNGKKYTVISVNTGKAFDKTEHNFIIKINTQETEQMEPSEYGKGNL